VNAVLISLDAKKAFDSVNHKYIEETLIAYGFGKQFVEAFKILYKDITARIMINGFQSEKIRIERGVKQGDALSCAIFIICIDPLIRNINKSAKVKEITIENKTSNKIKITHKTGAFADDISIICKNERESIQAVFSEYDKLTERSGLELNADKTEFLILNTEKKYNITFRYNNKVEKLQSVDKIKICGLYYCTNEVDEYDLNVIEKISKLSNSIKLWIPRHLTIEGKSLIIKTFGLSQLIYNMQTYGFNLKDLKEVERIIFKFLWSNNEKQNGVDRIKRSIMKSEYEEGGMKITDVECLDRSLKLRQFIRAQKSKHVISKIQKMTLG
jgi:hypothetical protein